MRQQLSLYRLTETWLCRRWTGSQIFPTSRRDIAVCPNTHRQTDRQTDSQSTALITTR